MLAPKNCLHDAVFRVLFGDFKCPLPRSLHRKQRQQAVQLQGCLRLSVAVRGVRGSMAVDGVEPPFATTDHRQVLGRSGRSASTFRWTDKWPTADVGAGSFLRKSSRSDPLLCAQPWRTNSRKHDQQKSPYKPARFFLIGDGMLDTKVNLQLAIQPLHVLFSSLEHVQAIEHHNL